MTLVKIRIWRIVWRDGESDVFFNEAEAYRNYCLAQSDCTMTEETRMATKAEE